MLRQVAKSTSKIAKKICPPLELDEFEEEEKDLVIGFQNIFVILWTLVQMIFFLIFLAVFLFGGEANFFTQRKDCCDNLDLKFTDDGLPWPDCAQKTCKLYSFTWDGDWDILDKLPREPANGKKSRLYTVSDENSQYCCNLDSDPDSDECCNFLPWNNSCGILMWGASLAAVCGMLMTQVLLAGFYSVFARRGEYYTGLAVIGGVFLRIFIFFLNFYLFFVFLFLFCFYWLGMMWCDNPYAFQWYKFGSFYFYYFFDNIVWVFTEGITQYEGKWDLDTMVATNTITSLIVDVVFWLLSILFRKFIRNEKDEPLFDFAYFEL